MILKDKVAVIYGAGGAIGGAVARAFASEGARVFLTGRSLAPVEAVAKDVVAAGGSAEAAEVNALDEQAVDRHLQSVICKADRVDISFDAIGIPQKELQGIPLADLPVESFTLPILTHTTSYFLTVRLAARRMVPKKSGVIMTVTSILLADGHPIGGRLRSGGGRQGGPHASSLRRARSSGHSRGWFATTGHAGDTHDQGRLQASRQGVGHDLGTVARVPRKQDPPATCHETRGAGKPGGLHGVRQGKRDDGNDRQLEHGQPGRLASLSTTGKSRVP